MSITIRQRTSIPTLQTQFPRRPPPAGLWRHELLLTTPGRTHGTTSRVRIQTETLRRTSSPRLTQQLARFTKPEHCITRPVTPYSSSTLLKNVQTTYST